MTREAKIGVGENPPRLPKRFFKSAAAAQEGGAFLIRLDGRTAKTRVGRPLGVSSCRLASAIAEEWNGQGEFINFAEMPMTRFAMTALDLGESDRARWREAVLSFLKSDLVCYRASDPLELVLRQRAQWDKLLEWSASRGMRLKTASGVSFVEQPADAIDLALKILQPMTAQTLLGVKSAAEIAGSAVIALALVGNAFPAEELFAASRVDEDYQAERWGMDAEAEVRATRLRRDFLAAARFLTLL